MVSYKNMGYYNYISIDVDAEDVLDKIDYETILNYLKENKSITLNDIDITDGDDSILLEIAEKSIEYMDDRQFYTFMEAYRNKGINHIPRNKQEMKEFICEIIDNNCYFN